MGRYSDLITERAVCVKGGVGPESRPRGGPRGEDPPETACIVL